MGYRTVVMLNNDLATAWVNDPNLGRKIADGNLSNRFNLNEFYGKRVQVAHADVQSLVCLDTYYGFRVLDQRTGPTASDEAIIAMMRDAADKLGYTLIKKSKKD